MKKVIVILLVLVLGALFCKNNSYAAVPYYSI